MDIIFRDTTSASLQPEVPGQYFLGRTNCFLILSHSLACRGLVDVTDCAAGLPLSLLDQQNYHSLMATHQSPLISPGGQRSAALSLLIACLLACSAGIGTSAAAHKKKTHKHK